MELPCNSQSISLKFTRQSKSNTGNINIVLVYSRHTLHICTLQEDCSRHKDVYWFFGSYLLTTANKKMIIKLYINR